MSKTRDIFHQIGRTTKKSYNRVKSLLPAGKQNKQTQIYDVTVEDDPGVDPIPTARHIDLNLRTALLVGLPISHLIPKLKSPGAYVKKAREGFVPMAKVIQ